MYCIVDIDKTFDAAQQRAGVCRRMPRVRGVQPGPGCQGAGRRHAAEHGFAMPHFGLHGKGSTRIGLIRPTQMLSALSSDPALNEIAKEVEAKTMQMIDNAR